MQSKFVCLKLLTHGAVACIVGLAALSQPQFAKAEPAAPLPLVPRLVKDINLNSASSMGNSCLGGLGTLGGYVFFMASEDRPDIAQGCALWKSDGTVAGTVKVKHVAAKGEGVTTSSLLFFSATGQNGSEFWRSDGTEAGTYKLATMSVSSIPVVVSDTVYFFVNAAVNILDNLPQLWKSDGTPSGTVLVKDFSSEQRSVLYELVKINERLYFITFYGKVFELRGLLEIWRIDHKPNGVSPSVAITLGKGDSTFFKPYELVAAGQFLFFTAYYAGWPHLWISDGTTAGTRVITQTASGEIPSDVSRLMPFDETVYFWAWSAQFQTQSLWVSDGTAAGTIRLFTSKSKDRELTKRVGNTVYFFGDDGVHGLELMKTDGTVAGTALVKDGYPNNTNVNFTSLTSLGNGLVFYIGAVAASFVQQLWVSDGSAAGTVSLTSGAIHILGVVPQINTVFAAKFDVLYGTELWKTDGTGAGTQLVKDINTVTYFSNPDQFTVVADKLFFTANSGSGSGAEIWQSDGTAAGTTAIAPHDFGTAAEMTASDNFLYLRKNNHLWRTDGSPNGTVRLSAEGEFIGDMWCKLGAKGGIFCGYGPASITNMGDHVFFLGRTTHLSTVGEVRAGLWRSDGTPAGTALVKDIPPENLTRAGDRLFFKNANTLWTSDGTVTGTQAISSFASLDLGWAAISSTLYFLASSNVSPDIVLWRSDGTAAGTSPVQLPITSIRKVMGLKDKIICLGTNNDLWVSDGTPAGTSQLATFEPSQLGSYWRVIGNRLFIQRLRNDERNTLIVTDGTPLGTQLLAEFGGSMTPGYIAALGDDFVFAHGNQLWATDGTANGTFDLVELPYANNDIGRSQNQALISNTLFFEATTLQPSYEPWALTFGDQPDVRLSVPVRLLTDATEPPSIAVNVTNFGTTQAQSVTLTATLGLSLTYLSDTSGITPTQQGNTLVWAWPNLGGLARKVFDLSVGLPNSAIGLSYPISFKLSTSASASSEQVVEVVTSKLVYLPLTFR
jgi:ELWxxDGT repeat protein